MTGNGSVTDGVNDADNVFDANMSGVTAIKLWIGTSTVTKTGIKLAASVTFTADVPTTFLKVIGIESDGKGVLRLAATSPRNLDF